jgi:hypothetical protein
LQEEVGVTSTEDKAGAAELDGAAQKVDAVSREALGSNYIRLKTDHLDLDEDFANGTAHVKAKLSQTSGDFTKVVDIDGTGVGLIDALFDALMKSYAPEHTSLNGISIVDFQIGIRAQGAHGRRTDAQAVATLRVKNSDNYEYAFTHRTTSISQSSVAVVQDVICFFVNSERAYIQLYTALEDAKKRARPDLVERYKNQMATLVEATSYREVAGRILTLSSSHVS